MSVTRFQEKVEADLSIISMYLHGTDMPEKQRASFLNAIKQYAKHNVYLAFARQQEALARIEEEYYSHE